MRIDSGFDYPGADLATVLAMLTDAEFQRERCAATGAVESTVEISGEPDSPTVISRRTMATEGLPDFVRKVVGASIEIADEVSWWPSGNGSYREAAVRLGVSGQPTKMSGRLELRADRSGTKGILTAELKGGLPLIGGRIEKVTATLILKAMQREQTVGRRWLTK